MAMVTRTFDNGQTLTFDDVKEVVVRDPNKPGRYMVINKINDGGFTNPPKN